MSGVPVSYEVYDGSTFLQAALQSILCVNYFDIPLIVYFVALGTFFYISRKVRNSTFLLTIIYFISISCVCFTENVNAYFNENWEQYKFSNNYFDPECVFIFIFWTAPFSIISTGITFGFFFDLCKSIAVHRFFSTILPTVKNEESKPKEK
ncbi:hypothetical protein TVAG_046380 [Trichomonas vaginalis G3]|uniref:Uncharacterized protein n=1 Tax=Trichomonas vaginalis (strain ATCC PRA-98 / G3) TaxID=412133 RepID=A2DMK7_TRIV3|nr:transmembrane protein 18 family [Trichomonas vaginalis G3]EAY18434.1 hypothetical protein TVAG_046380 [Trichomonas vaginalis G3]KAI5530287.1 transmembrane protein 18 family [Trichomonas vaginalis G3]|eukprot:XP_001579420.1 hypothetical protein [Trichomonas vaginalis G3]